MLLCGRTCLTGMFKSLHSTLPVTSSISRNVARQHRPDKTSFVGSLSLRFTPTGPGYLRSIVYPASSPITYLNGVINRTGVQFNVFAQSADVVPFGLFEWTCGCIVSCPVHSVGSRVASLFFIEQYTLYRGAVALSGLSVLTSNYPFVEVSMVYGIDALTPYDLRKHNCAARTTSCLAALRTYLVPSGLCLGLQTSGSNRSGLYKVIKFLSWLPYI